jgi:hypothetical protein
MILFIKFINFKIKLLPIIYTSSYRNSLKYDINIIPCYEN